MSRHSHGHICTALPKVKYLISITSWAKNIPYPFWTGHEVVFIARRGIFWNMIRSRQSQRNDPCLRLCKGWDVDVDFNSEPIANKRPYQARINEAPNGTSGRLWADQSSIRGYIIWGANSEWYKFTSYPGKLIWCENCIQLELWQWVERGFSLPIFGCRQKNHFSNNLLFLENTKRAHICSGIVSCPTIRNDSDLINRNANLQRRFVRFVGSKHKLAGILDPQSSVNAGMARSACRTHSPRILASVASLLLQPSIARNLGKRAWNPVTCRHNYRHRRKPKQN